MRVDVRVGLYLVATAVAIVAALAAAVATRKAWGSDSGTVEGFYASSDALNDVGNAVLFEKSPWTFGGRMMSVLGDMRVGRKVSFKDAANDDSAASKDPVLSRANAQPYRLEKVGPSIHATVAEQPDDAVEVWGDACASPGGCGGPGRRAHRLRADGGAGHRGGLLVGDPAARTVSDAFDGFDEGVSAFNPTIGAYSHLPWKDGKNYLRGDTVVELGDLSVGASSLSRNGTVTAGEELCAGDACVDAAAIGEIKGIPARLGTLADRYVAQARQQDKFQTDQTNMQTDLDNLSSQI
jgi:hypothetical protein